MDRAGRPLRRLVGRTIGPPRFLAMLALLGLSGWAHQRLMPAAPWTTSLALGFDLAAGLFLLSLLPLVRAGDAATIRRQAAANDANRLMVLIITSLLVLVVLTAIAGELPAARQGSGLATAALIATLLLAWGFANSVYALHYAHEYYGAHPTGHGDRGGLAFPATPQPGYIDFAYFAFTLGMTFQTSDVALTTSRMRGVALLHAMAAFIFNIGVIAFTINALGGGSG
ncbi:DUF1345 domain-containing protein [Novosphingobium piscinae]|uniref:DUF1345 domain-containing protein n=1 Tax=Novosphingobium piscinae TaxID=1507448 RepID=A0A7X1G0U7_9SPHN|nr:DUF1345 domain-containing protein [Novosphingobium piscinae]MBC2669922.1 DUF1345 domain-containing protein [Novosphingobium piscinae]